MKYILFFFKEKKLNSACTVLLSATGHVNVTGISNVFFHQPYRVFLALSLRFGTHGSFPHRGIQAISKDGSASLGLLEYFN